MNATLLSTYKVYRDAVAYKAHILMNKNQYPTKAKNNNSTHRKRELTSFVFASLSHLSTSALCNTVYDSSGELTKFIGKYSCFYVP